MSEKYYVVSESELERLYSAGLSDGMESGSDGWLEAGDAEIEQAEAACRAREVPEWATHFAVFGEEDSNWIPTEQEAYVIESKEIKR